MLITLHPWVLFPYLNQQASCRVLRMIPNNIMLEKEMKIGNHILSRYLILVLRFSYFLSQEVVAKKKNLPMDGNDSHNRTMKNRLTNKFQMQEVALLKYIVLQM